LRWCGILAAINTEVSQEVVSPHLRLCGADARENLCDGDILPRIEPRKLIADRPLVAPNMLGVQVFGIGKHVRNGAALSFHFGFLIYPWVRSPLR
jgi:hypothetical protein